MLSRLTYFLFTLSCTYALAPLLNYTSDLQSSFLYKTTPICSTSITLKSWVTQLTEPILSNALYKFLIRPVMKVEYKLLKFVFLTESKQKGPKLLNNMFKQMKQSATRLSKQDPFKPGASAMEDVEVLVQLTTKMVQRELSCLQLSYKNVRTSVMNVFGDGKMVAQGAAIPPGLEVQSAVTRKEWGGGNALNVIVTPGKEGVQVKVVGKVEVDGLPVEYEMRYLIPTDL